MKIFFLFLLLTFVSQLQAAESKFKTNQQLPIVSHMINAERKSVAECVQDRLSQIISRLNEDQRSDFFAQYLGYDNAANILNLKIYFPESILSYNFAGHIIGLKLEQNIFRIYNIKNHIYKDFNYSFDNVAILTSYDGKYIFFYNKERIYILDSENMKIVFTTTLKVDLGYVARTKNSFLFFFDNNLKIFNLDTKRIYNKKSHLDIRNRIYSYCLNDEQIILIYSDGSIILYDFTKDLNIASTRIDINGDPLEVQVCCNKIFYHNDSRCKLITYESGNFVFKDIFSCEPNEIIKSISNGKEYLIFTVNARKKYFKFDWEKSTLENFSEFLENENVIFWTKKCYVVKDNGFLIVKDIKSKNIIAKFYIGLINVTPFEFDGKLCLLYADKIRIFVVPEEFERFTFEQKQLIQDLAKAKELFHDKVIKFNEQQQKVFSTFNDLIQRMIKSNLNIVFAEFKK